MVDKEQESFEEFRLSMIAFVERNRNTMMSSMDIVDCIIAGYIDNRSRRDEQDSS